MHILAASLQPSIFTSFQFSLLTDLIIQLFGCFQDETAGFAYLNLQEACPPL
jgi:hypothetical protein